MQTVILEEACTYYNLKNNIRMSVSLLLLHLPPLKFLYGVVIRLGILIECCNTRVNIYRELMIHLDYKSILGEAYSTAILPNDLNIINNSLSIVICIIFPLKCIC